MNGINVMVSIELFEVVVSDPNRPENATPEDWINAKLWEYFNQKGA